MLKTLLETRSKFKLLLGSWVDLKSICSREYQSVEKEVSVIPVREVSITNDV